MAMSHFSLFSSKLMPYNDQTCVLSPWDVVLASGRETQLFSFILSERVRLSEHICFWRITTVAD